MKTPRALYVGQTKDTGALAFTEDFKKAHQFEWVNTYIPMSDHTSAVDELTRQNKILRDQRNYQIKQNTDSAEQYARLVAHEDEALKSCGGGDNE